MTFCRRFFTCLSFYPVFDGGLSQALASTSDLERSSWMDVIRQASYEGVRAELSALRQCIERKRNHKPVVDLQTWRLQHTCPLGTIIYLPLIFFSIYTWSFLYDNLIGSSN